MNREYYFELLPRDLHEDLLLFLDIDVDIIIPLCDEGFINSKLCRNDSEFWQKMTRYHITSDKQYKYNKSQYVNIIKNALYTDDNERSQINFMRYILKLNSDLLLINLVISYPNILDKIRHNLILGLMTNYISGENKSIYGLYIPIK